MEFHPIRRKENRLALCQPLKFGLRCVCTTDFQFVISAFVDGLEVRRTRKTSVDKALSPQAQVDWVR